MESYKNRASLILAYSLHENKDGADMEPYFEKYFHYTITDKENGLTVQRFLLSIGYSRHLLIRIKQTPAGITVNGLPAYTSHILKAGELLTVFLREESSSANIVPSPVPFHIIYEDDDILVINKEADTPIHPSQGNFSNTLANGIAWYFRQKGEPFVYRAINRLDRDTTGLLILARHGLSACILSDSIARRNIHREYLAICDGLIPWKGTVSAPIGRLCDSSIQRCVDFDHGDPAVTHYRRISYHPRVNLSLVSLCLETGRTHQIRVHMKYIGHPLLGDFLYHPDYRLIGRQALHSHRLSFCHPITKKELQFEAPLPDDMKQAINGL